MIGNDIVDLQLAKTQSNWQRKGFLEKQFTEKEQQEIYKATNPFLQVWLFWSMKEAAYKCYVQEFQKRFFAPKKFSCKVISFSEGQVIIGDKIYYIKTLISDNYIHSVATVENNLEMVSKLFFIDLKSSQTKIINAQLLTYFTGATSIKKNACGVPFACINDEKIDASFSTSHHGNYGGFAILK
ncbi:4'-phosphopantetheinyl transferase family protein [Polaribacter sp.]|uniref:4'-phosphopantetheinyl transferase family protein n=1 Tax=Polaribacter sp. TaxID=1920175 RepID=UPI003EF2EC9F